MLLLSIGDCHHIFIFNVLWLIGMSALFSVLILSRLEMKFSKENLSLHVYILPNYAWYYF